MKFLPSFLTEKRRVLDRVRRRQIKQRNIFLLVGVILTGLLISVWPTEARQAKDEISHVWRNVQRAGSYEFAADFTQHTISVASVTVAVTTAVAVAPKSTIRIPWKGSGIALTVRAIKTRKFLFCTSLNQDCH